MTLKINILFLSKLTKLFVLLWALLLSTQSYSYEKLDKIIAVIGENVIFSSDLERRLKQVKIRLQAQGKPNNISDEKLRSRVLENLISERLQLNLAERNNLTASDAEIDRALQKTKQGLKTQGISFNEYLNSQDLTLYTAKKELGKEIIIDKIQQGMINQRAKVTEREIDNFLSSKAGKEWLTPRLHLRHILIKGESPKKSLTQAKKLHKILQKSPHQFKKLAEKYSQGPNAAKGGDLGVQRKVDLPDLFITEVEGLKIGDISKPFSSGAGVHILQLLNRQGAEPVIVKQYKVRHLLVKTTELFSEQEATDKINSLYQRIIAGESLADLAREHTDDVASKLDGGDLGWSNPQVFVPEFSKVVESAPIGTISKPFKTGFGWHILMVEEQRTKDVFDTVKRNQAAKILRRQRFNDELQIWLQELRDNTYVEVLI